MTDIYDEVLADKKKLLEVAEMNAKNKIVTAITPRIKELVENAILGKLNEGMPGDEEDILLGVVDDEVCDDACVAPGAAESVVPQQDAAVSLPDIEGKVTLDVDAIVVPKHDEQQYELELTPESINALSTLVGVKNDVDVSTIGERASKIESLAEKIVAKKDPTIKDREQAKQIKLECQRVFSDIQGARDFLDEAWAKDTENKLEKVFHKIMERYSAAGHVEAIVKEMLAINHVAGALNENVESRDLTKGEFDECVRLLKHTQNLHETVRKLHESIGADDDSIDASTVRAVGANLATLYGEIRKMVTKNSRRINEADELDVGGSDVADVEGDAAGVSAEKVLVQLELPVSLKDIRAGDAVSVVDVSSLGDEDVDVEDVDVEEVGDEEVGEDSDVASLDDIDVELSGDEAEVETDEADVEEGSCEKLEADELDENDIIEIDEAELVAEMKKMRKLREKKDVVNQGGHGPGDHAVDFGGGCEEDDVFVDSPELNKCDDVGCLDEADEAEEAYYELDEEDYGVSGDKWSKERDKKEMGESHQKGAKNNGQPKEKRLAETLDKVRAELAEQKLFNTKLIALNRVLQIPGLKKAQRAKIVEVLDKGQTVAEVQQLYSKIVNVLKKDTKTVNESARVSSGGSSSRVTTATSSSESDEQHPLLERWSKIAFGGTELIKG